MPNLNKAYTWTINKCNAPNIGYSMDMNRRNGVTVGGITYYDCSSLMNFAIIQGGWSTPQWAPSHQAFSTYTMGGALVSLGWKQYSVTSSFVWKPGDIGVVNSSVHQHTEMCYKGGVNGSAIFMGAHTNNAPLADQVSIDTTPISYFQYCYRYGSGGASGGGDEPGAVNEGISAYVIAAMCGNFWTESNVNPGVWESLTPVAWDAPYSNNTGGYGLGQWTNYNTNQGRLYRLHEWMTQNGYAMDSMEGQLAYLRKEGYWTPKAGVPYQTLEQFLTSESTDLNALTQAWLLCWEGINNGTLPARQAQAKKAYDYIVKHGRDDSINSYIKENRYLSEAEILNNCVMVFKLFGGSGTSSGTPFSKGSMPIWMMIKY